MKVGIMQPYFFPYLGHFALIMNTDYWVVFDVTQFTPKSWMSRNRVLHPKSGWNYINVPLMNSSISILTHQARVQDLKAAHVSVIGKLSHYRRKAPFYEQVISLVNLVFSSSSCDSLVGLNVNGLQSVCDYLDVPFNYSICSELGFELGRINHPGGWAPAIAESLGASVYLNPVGGRALFDPIDFSAKGIDLGFIDFTEFEYETGPYNYEPNLSILDVLMWNEPEVVRNALINNSRIL